MSKLKMDLSVYTDEKTDQHKIDHLGQAVPCRICNEVFARVRLTWRYCNTCKRGFCEGEHGNFIGQRGGVCVRCYKKAQNDSELMQKQK